jgi:hypothetical protein
MIKATLALLLLALSALGPASAATAARQLQARGEMKLMNLRGFAVEVERNISALEEVRLFDVTDEVRAWMNASFAAQLVTLGYGNASFDALRDVVLVEYDSRQNATVVATQFSPVGAFFHQGTWRQDDDEDLPTLAVPEEVMRTVQQIALDHDEVLLRWLQRSSAPGLGAAVVQVRAYLVEPNKDEPDGGTKDPEPADTTSSSNDSLEIVILVAIAVAGIAFLFLLFAVFWAWRYEQRNRQAYLLPNLTSKTTPPKDATESPSHSSRKAPSQRPNSAAPSPVSVIDIRRVGEQDTHVNETLTKGSNYPESVVSSEDIESSLSQYYQGPGGSDSHGHASRRHQLNDAASISSMDSYGYSLDGYAPSLVTKEDLAPGPRLEDDEYYHTTSPPHGKKKTKTTLSSPQHQVGMNLPTEPAGYADADFAVTGTVLEETGSSTAAS